jgi:hypothetical protein
MIASQNIHYNLSVLFFFVSFELFVLLLFGSIVASAVLLFESVSQHCKTAKGDSDSLNC